MSRAAIASGADGLMVEVHTSPEDAYSDGAQSLLPEKFDKMMKELSPVAKAVGREL
jgi:3-deoxy-7-phosphoheptulonate synthase